MLFDLHDLVALELVDEPQDVRQFFRRELEVFEVNSLSKDVDIKITFTDQINLGNDVTFVGATTGTTAAYDSESICVTSFSKRLSMRVKAFEQSKYDIVCETGIKPVEVYNFLVFFVIQPVLLKKGATFVHSSAVILNHIGILLSAWRDTGKTSIMIRALEEGAAYLSDDLAIIRSDGTMLSFPGRINVTRPDLARALIRRTSNVLMLEHVVRRIVKSALRVSGKILQRVPIFPIGGLGTLTYQLGQGIHVGFVVPVATLFPRTKIEKSCTIGRVFFLARTADSRIEIEETTTESVVDKMRSSLLAEIDFHVPELHEVFRFAFPDKGGQLMEEREQEVKRILLQALSEKEAYYVKLPWNFDMSQAFSKLLEYS